MRQRRKWLWFVSVVVVGWACFHMFTDEYGKFDPPQGLDHAMYRVGRGVGTTTEEFGGSITETNRDSQAVFDGRMDRNDARIARDKQAAGEE